jgi:hypothetical protein
VSSKRLLNGINIKKEDFLKANINMKFDIIVGNPPYKAGLHIKFFNKSFKLLKEDGIISFIHPSTPFINRKKLKPNNETKQIKDIVSKYKTELKLINGNTIFNAGFFVPLSITQVTKELNKNISVIYEYVNGVEPANYTTLDDLYVHGNPLVLSIRDKIFSKMKESIEDHSTRKLNKKYPCYIIPVSIGGNPPTNKTHNPDFYCIIFRQDENNLNKVLITEPIHGMNCIGFKSREHAVNGFSFMKTKFARFCVSLSKINVHLDRGELLTVPYMDFSQEWTDEKLFDYFELTKEERNYINEYIQNWYNRDFT